MENKIEDYLHYYKGATIIFKDGSTAEIIGMVGNAVHFISHEHNQHGFCTFDSPLMGKIALRPLSSMTEDELLKVFSICYKSVFDSQCNMTDCQMVSSKEGGGLRVTETVMGRVWHYGLTVDRNLIMFSSNGDQLTIPIFDITAYLLSHHFDLFGLIGHYEELEAYATIPV